MSDVPILPAATILLVRDDPAFEVLMVKRHHQIDFASGALVFPGGKTHAGDHDPRWIDRSVGWDGVAAEKRPLRIAAIREAYEESGILLVQRADGSPYRADERAHLARDVIAKDQRSFLDLVEELDVKLDLAALTVFARWITPPLTPKRFDTWFYVARAPEDQIASCDGWETVDAEWVTPKEVLRMAAAKERTVIFPTRMNVQLLAEASSAADVVARAEARPLVTVLPEVQGDFLVIPPDAGYGPIREPMSAVRGR